MIAEREAPAPAPPPPLAGRRVERLLGRLTGARPGPTLVAIGGVHGNEPAGVAALLRVIEALSGRQAALSGELVALAGNRQALARGERYLARDLNRSWTAERVEALRRKAAAAPLLAEDREQLELLAALEEAFGRARGRTYVLDLHSTSGEGPPFVVLADSPRSRAFGGALEAPMVLGLEEQLEGTLLSYLVDRGRVTVAFESGQHADPLSVDRAEAAVWRALLAAGLLDRGEAPAAGLLGGGLAPGGRRLPRVVRVRYRHALGPEDGFRMRPGYRNFQPVERGERLAHDRRGIVASPESGLILMPLYQEKGDDGFFLVRAVGRVWLGLSALLRRLGADRVVHRLPGVRRHPERAGTYLVDRRVARWYALELFHLLGFRRVGAGDGRQLVVARHPHLTRGDQERDQSRPAR
jgi:succinylglutamate desuccinylase